MALTHEWQKLGFAPPFKLVGFFSMPPRSLAEANPSAYANAMQEMPRGCGIGSCGICGVALVNNYILKDSSGVKFSVGCDCVEKHGDSRLISDVEAHKKKIAREKRQANRLASQEAKYNAYLSELVAQRERNGGMTDDELERHNRDVAERDRLNKVLDLVQPIADILHRQNGDFCRSMTAQLNDGKVNGLSPRAISIIADICKKNGLPDTVDRIDRAKRIS